MPNEVGSSVGSGKPLKDFKLETQSKLCFGDDICEKNNTSREPNQEAVTTVQVRSNEDLDQHEDNESRKDMMGSKVTRQIESARLGT